ncbi:DUF1194 domain-containing protein [Rhizobium sp. BK251]|uniref:DUF1194 domain-containing protein n=1 Tax=Rhizobium sp. BK251 TaxID=2512125 RepID=UPI00104AF675|nr:DUF1194 domain-containing protein [Rhizobium sp. BK251]TCL70371.1 uncharacterized protein DUF1194 [Rhizobium sp. BK251]
MLEGKSALLRHASLLLVCALLAGACPRVAESDQSLDVSLVIAADVSTSMDAEEKALQQQGFAEAFRRPEVVEAIRRGRHGRIAVTYVEWGGERQQRLVVPWTVIATEEDAWRFSIALEQNFPSKLRRGTSISGVLAFASHLFYGSGSVAERRVINISSDGINNGGPPLQAMRDNLVAQGVTINGMPIVYRKLAESILYDPDETASPEALQSYFRKEVIGGAGAFIEPIATPADYSAAIARKLLREITGEGYTAALDRTVHANPLPSLEK